jgi:HlyD family secretion protein
MVVGIIAALVVLLASFMPKGAPVPIRAAQAQRETIRSVISTNGRIEPAQNFEAHAPVGTTVKRLLVKEGDQVKKGQLLVQLDDAQALSQAAQALAQVRSAQADLSAIASGGNQEEVLNLESQLVKAKSGRDLAQRNLDALIQLQQTGAASPGEISNAQNQLAKTQADLAFLEQKKKDRYSKPEVARAYAQESEAQAAYDAAEGTLAELNIRAPFSGTVYAMPLHLGTYVNPGDLVLQEADLSKVLVRAFVDEPDVGRLAAGQPIEVTWDAVPDRIWNGTVTVIPAEVKLHGTRNVGETTCLVDNHDHKLLPNVNVGITIVTSEHKDVLTLPREALRQDEHGNYVLQVVDQELHRRDVTTSISNLTKVEVTGGLGTDAYVALTSLNSKPLLNGSRVKVVP